MCSSSNTYQKSKLQDAENVRIFIQCRQGQGRLTKWGDNTMYTAEQFFSRTLWIFNDSNNQGWLVD